MQGNDVEDWAVWEIDLFIPDFEDDIVDIEMVIKLQEYW